VDDPPAARRAIIDAASELYGQRGLDTPFDDIARHAGVGNATLYRHFPSRCSLLAAVFTDTLARVVTAAEDALTIADPWDAFATHFRFLCHLQATNRGLADLLTTAALTPSTLPPRSRPTVSTLPSCGRRFPGF
jgi:AcrR family transcriptional regulator